ncbi:uncharacterized protein TM35_000251170 [Trypanosoma theileri]|uniref:Uncharacterized protein n=1 Tax=Trypanosoma theileri TaxID=67003 RepID=A0A1X0NQE0_9TRYP|nr:uncharacterized protein TM35_000251170 [Trypanosoma theileri]ORC86821.1 hypothetical protein TM35_000251170 [Trypanosoma theileri]
MGDLLEHFRDVMSFQQHGRTGERVVSASSLENNPVQSSTFSFKTSPFAQHSVDNNNNNIDSKNNKNNDDDDDAITEDDQTELIRLLNEVTHTVCQRDETETTEIQHSGGFVVEESYGPLQSVSHAPPLYAASTPSQPQVHGGSPFSYAGIPHVAKPPPPSFAEAIAATPPIAAVPVELSPLAAHYVPPMPAAQQDPILLRNEHGVFLLQPIAKPTPPYTPPSLSSPISPLPRYALPPAAPPQQPQHFLGSSLAQAGGLADTHLNKKSSGGLYGAQHSPNTLLGGSHVLSSGAGGGGGSSGSGAYTYISTSVKTKPLGFTPPPPYPT